MRGNGCLLLTGYYWSFFNVLSKLDLPNCRVGLSMLSVHLGAVDYEASHHLSSQTARLKRHFISESDSIRGEQPGSKPNKSVCQVWNKSVDPCLLLIALRKTHKSHPVGGVAAKISVKMTDCFCFSLANSISAPSLKLCSTHMVIQLLSRSIATSQKAY